MLSINAERTELFLINNTYEKGHTKNSSKHEYNGSSAYATRHFSAFFVDTKTVSNTFLNLIVKDYFNNNILLK